MEMTLTIEAGGKLTLPNELITRYGFDQNTPIRIIETQSGLLLIPLTDEPMSESLRREIEDWQQLSILSFSEFPYEEEHES